ncbi:SDR family NAD(P)-dependent oxidoreductase, partial [Streptomyces sp. NPDC001508]|uniref:SDR family NAD(P)-dependent oxidoreductase n=1 Tax=Streptomyces sp. NPDC001508 TaxID=3154656 RepID=UPI003324D247
WTHGQPTTWPHPHTTTHTPLPTYPFQHKHHWLNTPHTTDTTGHAPVESEFWNAVEHEDLDALSEMLTLGDTSSADSKETLRPALSLLSDWRRAQRTKATLDSWRYHVVWRPAQVSGDREEAATGAAHWVLVVPEDAAASPWIATAASELKRAGARVRFVTVAAAERVVRAREFSEQLGSEGAVTGILSCLALPAGPVGADDPALSTLAVIQAWADSEIAAPLWCVTSGAVSVGRSDPLLDERQAQVWGLGQTAGLEHADRWGGLIDLPETRDERTAVRLAKLLTAPGAATARGEDQLAVRSSGVYVRRLVRATAVSPSPAASTGRADGARWRRDGTVLITGGTGALGAQVARHLASSGAQHLVLAGRRGDAAPGAAALRDELRELAGDGARVDIVACDVGDRAAVFTLFSELDATGTPVVSVFHAAGTAPTVTLVDTNAEHLADARAAKVLGVHHLDEALEAHGAKDLGVFVLFSSAAGVWGGREQGAYGAANAHLDAFALRRRQRGRHALSVAWGTWGGGGLAASGGAEEALRRIGLPAMSPDLAVQALQQALDRDETAVTVADIDWRLFAPTLSVARSRPLITEVPDARDALDGTGHMGKAASGPDTVDGGPAASTSADTWAGRWYALKPKERDHALLDLVRGEAASVLGHTDTVTVAPQRAFNELGFDSVTAVQFRNRLRAVTGLHLATTLVFDHPSPRALVDHLTVLLTGRPSGTGSAAVDTTTSPAAMGTGTAADNDPIVIVSMSCRFPGGADSPESLWGLVATSRDAVIEFPEDRGWDLEKLYDPQLSRPGTSYAREGAFLHDAGGFDAALFGISPREALAMDPQQRLLLETSWEAFERAGIDPSSLRGSRTGVFAGAATSYYGIGAALGSGGDTVTEQGAEGYLLTGTATAVVSGRVAYSFGLEGPAVTVDTACSSSLVALHLATQALRNDECSLALVGGVTVMATPAPFVEFSRQRGLAADGRCKAFSADADGTGWGEGVGVVLVERLSDARRNGHPVLAVVRGSAVNQDGASNGLSAPNGPSQQRVIRQALANAGLEPRDVDAVEAHGTGTRLGDPIEAQALIATYGQDRNPQHPLWLGSVKSNIGHTQAAAGVAGIIKMVMAMHHGTLPRTLHINEPTPEVDWTAGDVALLTDEQEWPDTGRPRRAAISSFGVSGTNAHVILEEAPATEPTPPPTETSPGHQLPTVPWILSARNENALRDQAANLAAHLSTTLEPDTPLENIAHALATTRTTMEHRAVLTTGTSLTERTQLLKQFARGGTPQGIITGRADGGRLAFIFTGQGSQRL